MEAVPSPGDDERPHVAGAGMQQLASSVIGRPMRAYETLEEDADVELCNGINRDGFSAEGAGVELNEVPREAVAAEPAATEIGAAQDTDEIAQNGEVVQFECPERSGASQVVGGADPDPERREEDEDTNGCLVQAEISDPELPEVEALSRAEAHYPELLEVDEEATSRAALTALKGSASGSSNVRSFINSVICFIGSGMLGLPFAFQHVGVIGGLLGLSAISVVALHCMFLVVDTRQYLQEECSKHIKTYGDIGFYAFGRIGSVTVDGFIMLTQMGFCIAYLIFVSESMQEVMVLISKRTWIVLCMPLLVLFSWFRSLKPIAPLSLLAEVSLSIACITVLFFDVRELSAGGSIAAPATKLPRAGNADRIVIMNLQGIPYFFGVAVYCFEGVGMVMPVMNSMKDPERFKLIWGSACVSVALLYLIFGSLGYMAFKSHVADVITTNMPKLAMTNMMKVSLCLALLFTYPIMLFPVIELVEELLGRTADSTQADMVKRNALRASFVLVTGIVAHLVPKFGVFISLVGASASAALAFILPSLFHLKLRFSKMTALQRWRGVGYILFGVVGGTLGTLNAVKDLRASFA